MGSPSGRRAAGQRGPGALALAGVLCGASACAAGPPPGAPEPIAIEFGQERYLSDTYLARTPGARCGHPAYAPGGTEVRAPLPDGSWFRVFSIGDDLDRTRVVVLERGTGEGEPALSMRLDGEEGIVRLEAEDRRDAWGIHHRWADWMRELGRRAEALDCASSAIQDPSR